VIPQSIIIIKLAKYIKRAGWFSIEKMKEMIKNGEKFHPELLFILNKYFFH